MRAEQSEFLRAIRTGAAAFAVILGAATSLTTAACAQGGVRPGNPSVPWAGRSGQAEALADIAKGRPIKLYYQWIAGEREFIRTPGLRNCNPDRFDVPEDARSNFVHIGADFSESIRYTEEELSRFDSATLFAKAYNVTMFTNMRDEILRICPAATLD